MSEGQIVETAEPSVCVASEHLWSFVKDDVDAEWVVTDRARHGLFVGLRDRLFGPLRIESLGIMARLGRTEWWVKGWRRKWACQRCRVIVWDYEESGRPNPALATDGSAVSEEVAS